MVLKGPTSQPSNIERTEAEG